MTEAELERADSRTTKQLEELIAVQRDIMLQRVETGLPVSWLEALDGTIRVWSAHPFEDRWHISHEGSYHPFTRMKRWLVQKIARSVAIPPPPMWHWSLTTHQSPYRNATYTVWRRIS